MGSPGSSGLASVWESAWSAKASSAWLSISMSWMSSIMIIEVYGTAEEGEQDDMDIRLREGNCVETPNKKLCKTSNKFLTFGKPPVRV